MAIRGSRPCAKGPPPKFSRLCHIDGRTVIGTEAWQRNNSAGARRVDAIRALHAIHGSHENVPVPIVGTRTREMVRLIKKSG